MKGNQIITRDNAHAFERSLEMLHTSIQELTRVTNNLVPESITRSGLVAALTEFCDGLKSAGTMEVIWQAYGIENLRSNERVDIQLYRIIRELTILTIKQTRASQLLIQLSYHHNFLQITIEDNDTHMEHPSGEVKMNWQTIQSNINSLRGTMDVHGEPGKGNSITITVPI